MQRPNMLVVVVDGLRASALGAYGNTTFPTPALDEFAAEGVLYDSCFAPTSDLGGIYRALWWSRHPARIAGQGNANGAPGDLLSLAARFEKQGYDRTLITDEPELASAVDGRAFVHANLLPSLPESPDVAGRAEDVSQTQLARFFASVADAVRADPGDDYDNSTTRPRLVWAHTRGMYGAWDAPLELQEMLRDEDDPLPIDDTVPPEIFLTADADPDLVFSHTSAYAAQIMVLDDCWRNLVEVCAPAELDSWLVMLIGARGFPLGEHRKIGGIDKRLYTEQLHVPWLVRLPNAVSRLARTGALTTHLDVLPTLVDALGDEAPSSSRDCDGQSVLPLAEHVPAEWRDALLAADSGAFALRTGAWCLRVSSNVIEDDASGSSQHSSAELFVRPDDRWEANDVSKLCADIAEELRSAALRVLQMLTNGGAMPSQLLAETAEST